MEADRPSRPGGVERFWAEPFPAGAKVVLTKEVKTTEGHAYEKGMKAKVILSSEGLSWVKPVKRRQGRPNESVIVATQTLKLDEE